MTGVERLGLSLLHRLDPERAHGLSLLALRAGLVPLPGPVDLPRLHGTDERISVANLGELVRFYHQLLRNLNAPAP